MARYKVERCRACGYRHNEPKPGKVNKPCPRCGTEMYYSKNWYISYQTEGVKYVEAVSPRAMDADDAVSKRKVQIRENRFFDIKADIPWHSAVEKLRSTYNRIKSATSRMYENSIAQLEAHGFKRYRLTDPDFPDRIADFISHRQNHVTNASINRDLATLKRMAKLCKLYDLFNEIRMLPENNERIRYLTEAEQAALLEACESPQMRMAVLIALNTGLRAEGVYKMMWEHIDFQTMTITRQVKRDKQINIPLTPQLAHELKEYRKQSILSKYVFPSPVKSGESIRSDNRRGFKNACTRAGITDFRFHDLRHTFATWFLYRTRDKRALQEILGHSDSRMTDRYAHILDEHKREAMQKFADAAAGNT